ncbi:MAG: hypothetical protein ACFHU9_13170 [Fluviicola sp.]
MGLFSRNKKPKQEVKENPYPGLRTMAFSVSSEDLGLNLDETNSSLYGVIMDWDMGNGIVTLVAYKSGDTSLYISSGAGFIGAGRHQDVNQLVKSFVAESESLIENAQPDSSNELPVDGGIVFHFLTKNGKYAIKDNINSMENKTSPNLGFFEAANQVISAIRIASERK